MDAESLKVIEECNKQISTLIERLNTSISYCQVACEKINQAVGTDRNYYSQLDLWDTLSEDIRRIRKRRDTLQAEKQEGLWGRIAAHACQARDALIADKTILEKQLDRSAATIGTLVVRVEHVENALALAYGVLEELARDDHLTELRASLIKKVIDSREEILSAKVLMDRIKEVR